MPDSNTEKSSVSLSDDSKSVLTKNMGCDAVGKSGSPIFVHSLWRSGSTYIFHAFRRSSAGYWCYQEPVHEEAVLRANDPDGLLKSDKELARRLRHPELDKPYFQELFETHSSWNALVKKSILYDEYFSSVCSDALSAYLKSLITAARGRPVIQECRTSNRIGVIKKAVGGVHLYLWRNPWDQWWSFKCAEYFDVVAQLVVNAPEHPAVIGKLRAEIGFSDFHDPCVVDEMKYFEMRRLPADDSYLVFFVLWCLAWLEAKQHADFSLNIDRITESEEYRAEVVNRLSQFGIDEFSLDDCNVHSTAFALEEREFFRRNEDRGFGLLLSGGISSDELDALRASRLETLPETQLKMRDATDGDSVFVDAFRARDIVLRTETASVSRIRYLLMEWGGAVTREVNNHQKCLAMQGLLEDAQRESRERLSDALAKEQEANHRLSALMDQTKELVSQLQREKQQSLEIERICSDQRENLLRQEIDFANARLNELRQEFDAQEQGFTERLKNVLDMVMHEANTRNAESLAREKKFHEHVVEIERKLTTEKLQALNAQLVDIRLKHDNIQANATSLREELGEAVRQLDLILSSLSWKLTKPLRWVIESHLNRVVKANNSSFESVASSPLGSRDSNRDPALELLGHDHFIPSNSASSRTDSRIFEINHMPLENNLNMVNDINDLLDLHGAAFVTAAYKTILGRTPDPEGMRYYLSRLADGLGKRAVIFQISQSEEARKLIDIGEMPELDDDAFIANLYRALLRREPDQEGKRHYLGRLRAGKSRKLIVSEIKKSPEAKRRGLRLPGLERLCREERWAGHWLFGRLSRSRRLDQQINRLEYGIGHGLQRLNAMMQQGQVQAEARFERTASLLQQQARFSFTNRDTNPLRQKQVDGALNDIGIMPKILHRVYFENYSPFYDPFPHYLETWKRELPSYEIMKWGHENVDVSANEWLRRSADASDPVFLSEFVRWDVLKKYGGIYLDSDCEVLDGNKFDSLVNELMNSTEYDAFVGVEEFYNGHPTAQTVAAKKGAALVDFMHEMYSGALSGSLWHWRAERGLIGPQLMSLYFREHGLLETKGFPVQLKEPIIVGRVKIYPQEYFSPKFTTTGKKLAVSENTCIYHLFANLNVKDVDPEAEKHRRSPLLFNEYCGYLAKLHAGKTAAEAMGELGGASGMMVSGSTGIRKLHRIYFGFDGKPDPYRRYLDTWVKQMPGYEICHWNTTNLPIDNCEFSRMMYELKDHAFLSDYFRWWILREHGGIYLDADVEITNGQLLDRLVSELEDDDNIHSFIGIDSKADGWYTAHSMACKKGSRLAEFMCEVYEGLGHASLWRRKIFYFMAPQLTSLYFANHGWNVDGMGSSPNLSAPIVVEGVKIYPQEWFSPMRPQMRDGVGGFEIDSYTGNTCICHHFSCSWHSDDSPYKSKSNEGKKYLLLDELVSSDAQWR